jgi:peptidoglycan/LPS O-acetylase OafA/YrhL
MKPSVAKHVPELDGLRGIAILSVISHHHLAPFSLSGGFLGVDLFFVLSGFLITALLLAEFTNTASISLKNFYMRRLLRLGPALAVYLFASLFVTYLTQTIALSRQLKLIAFAVFYSTNWRMAFGWDSFLDPTAIIWSLSIEEQFYLVWPLVLFGCLAFKVRVRHIAAGLAVVILIILVHRYSMLAGGTDLTRLYYGTDTRADALLVGCLFGLLNSKNISLPVNKWLKSAGVIAALALAFLISVSEFSDRILYQGGFTMVALVSGIVIFVAANAPPHILSSAFSFTPLRWFGHISYGLYLWHWLVVRNASFYSLGRWESSAKLALAVGIAATSFYFIERPFNQLKTRFAARPSSLQTASTKTASEKLGVRPTHLAAER